MRLILLLFTTLLIHSCTEKGNEQTPNNIQSNDSLVPIESQVSLKKFYDFEVTIDVQHLQRNNEYNYKYLINVGWDFNQHDSLIFFENDVMQFIQFNYQKNEDKGFDHYDRIPMDTTTLQLTKNHLDSVYAMTSTLFEIDTSNLTSNEYYFRDHYDGWWAEIKLSIDHIATYQISLSGESDQKTGKKFNTLLEYVVRLKKSALLNIN